MTLINRTKGVVVCEDVHEAKTAGEKTRGLIGSNGTHGLLIKTRWGIHTLGMKFPIDVAVMDKKNRIVKTRREMPPGRMMFWNPRHSTVVEIPSALLPAPLLEKGDELEWKKT